MVLKSVPSVKALRTMMHFATIVLQSATKKRREGEIKERGERPENRRDCEPREKNVEKRDPTGRPDRQEDRQYRAERRRPAGERRETGTGQGAGKESAEVEGIGKEKNVQGRGRGQPERRD
jgi:hypothetical protein